MKIEWAKQEDRPMVKVLPTLEVSVRRVTWWLRIGHRTFKVIRMDEPVIPEAFRDLV